MHWWNKLILDESEIIALFASTYNPTSLAYLLKKVNERCLLTIMNIHLLGFSSLFDPQKLGYFKLQFEAFLLILSCKSYSYSSFKLVN